MQAGDTMTGNLQMKSASVKYDNTMNTPTGTANWDIQESNVLQVANELEALTPHLLLFLVINWISFECWQVLLLVGQMEMVVLQGW